MRTAVVGHVEWVTFASVDRVPEAGEIVHAGDVFDVPAGGGPVAAVQLRKLAGECTLYTALGNDELGHRAHSELERLGLRIEAVFRDEPQRRAFTHVDADGERTITVMGSRLGPQADDPLPWDELDDVDAVYFCAGDDGALRHARRARTLVVTSREAERVARTAVRPDAVVGSGRDPSERHADYDPQPDLIIETFGAEGGTFRRAEGQEGRYDPAPLPGPLVDLYGAGDSFVAGLTFALGRRDGADDALALAARCGAACATGRGPYEGQLALPRG